tara:strand:+ start:147 stop:701 length:555 start_codon:yes stop_codon:yes gene_type:complete
MASELHVDAIKHSGGTSAMTINSSGNVNLPGAIIQTQFAQDLQTGTNVTTASSSAFVDLTGMTVTITPKFSTSKILVMYNYHIWFEKGSSDWVSSDTKLVRTIGGSATDLIGENPVYGTGYREEHAGTFHLFMYQAKQYIDSPSTTSATTYKVQGKLTNNTLTHTYNSNTLGTGASIVAMEVAQ